MHTERQCLNCGNYFLSPGDEYAFCGTYCQGRYWDYEFHGCDGRMQAHEDVENLAENDVGGDS